MGIYDRDYYRQPPPSRFATMRLGSVTTWLIIINVAVFILDQLLFQQGRGWIYSYIIPTNPPIRYQDPPIAGLGHFSLYLAIGKLEIWRFITFQFLHAGLTHLVFNMLSLFFFGPLVESYLGARKYLAFYLLCGIGGPVSYFILWICKFLIAAPWVPLVGASAGIFGILIAAAKIAPNATVLVYGAIPVRLRTLAWIMLAVAAYTVLVYGQTGRGNAGGEAAHLGGAAVGYFFIRNPHWLRLPDLNLIRRRRPPF